MSELSKRTLLISSASVVIIACLTALLRASWEFWGPAVALSSGGGAALRSLGLLLGGLLVPFLVVLVRRQDWARGSVRWLGGAVAAGLLIGFVVGTAFAKRSESEPMPPAEYAHMNSLLDSVKDDIDLEGIQGDLMFTCIAVVESERVRSAAQRFRRAVLEGYEDSFLYHFVIIGGPDIDLIDQVLRRATRWLPKYAGSRVQIIIATPTPVSDAVVKTLEAKGLKAKQVTHEFTDVPFDVAVRR